jgi:TPP-dependent pyruvate/acetoin dehydrogenase alpha subunit
MAMGSKAFESPLIGHARMRAMYRALVEVRALAERQKTRAKKSPLRGVEACWVGTAIDLKEGDLTSDTGGFLESALLGHVRAVGRRAGGKAAGATEIKRVLERLEDSPGEPFPGSACDRLLCAAGAAMALKAASAQAVALAYARLDELSGAEWKRVLTVMGQEGLPLVMMVLPGESKVDLEAMTVKAAGSTERAVPVIPVDAGDAVAIYRVTQETMVRARAGGGAALILGVPCRTDAVKLLGTQLVRKQICTERWVAAVETHLKALLASL